MLRRPLQKIENTLKGFEIKYSDPLLISAAI